MALSEERVRRAEVTDRDTAPGRFVIARDGVRKRLATTVTTRLLHNLLDLHVNVRNPARWLVCRLGGRFNSRHTTSR
jgi:hypothetical protein